MGLFYKATLKERLDARVDIFVKNGIPALERNGFIRGPYYGMRFGKYDGSGRVYDLCRLTANSHLEIITTYISRKDRWIQVFLNIFELKPPPESMEQLRGLDCIQFYMFPNGYTRMRLRLDDFKGMPLFRTVEHKLRRYYTKRGFKKRVAQLGELIGNDLTNIDSFVTRWHELHKPLVTDWEGKEVDGKGREVVRKLV
jgi:hypothetical protein